MDKSKGQKIIAAVYLVTDHLTDSDPLKSLLREEVVALVMGDVSARSMHLQAIETMLGASVLARLVSEKNASIINLEINHFVRLGETKEYELMSSLFSEPAEIVAPIKKTLPSNMSYMSSGAHPSISKTSKITNENKSNRQGAIMSFINDRKSASIKDIAALFPDTSEKTIQRELGSLVADGKITKRGQKRWSVYMAVASN